MRVKTGMDGLDELIEGGFPKGSVILVSGMAGTGKSIFSMQYIYKGLEMGENGVYITLEEGPEELRKEARRFSWDLREYEDEGKLVILDVSTRVGLPPREKYFIEDLSIENLLNRVYEICSEIGAKRLVLDSLPPLFQKEENLRPKIHKIGKVLNETGCTSLIISETIRDDRFSRFGIEEFISRGLITLHLEEIESKRRIQECRRSIFIRKMRQTKHKVRKYPFYIDEEGISIDTKGELL
ncbi:MAG: ATPase domain-containing protein [Euryarchaeota archaeon]|nr:ATPase domain-containing protein [Euryarchaeota archaeon]